MVLGGAGTGKTTTALWAARTFLESPAATSSSRVLFMTFSRSAVSQIISRSPGVISGLEERIEVSTFHALAFRLIRAFGRYAGYGTKLPAIQGEARVRLLGRDQSQLLYDDLMPEAIRILQSNRNIRELVTRRWGLIICDEVQDTNDQQWRFLQQIAHGKVMLLGDDNQMIYTFLPGVSQERFDTIRNSVDRVVQLEQKSHRDPSGVIPRLAEAIRTRQFTSDAVFGALVGGRLAVHFDVDDDNVVNLLCETIDSLRRQGARDVGIFAHSNSSVADLSGQLTSVGVRHVLVGIPEAHAEGLALMATQCAYSAGLVSREKLRAAFGIFLASATRSRNPPCLARALVGASTLPDWLEIGLLGVEQQLTEAGCKSIDVVSEIAARSWEAIGIPNGVGPWRRASGHFGRLTRSMLSREISPDSINELVDIVQEGRMQALVEVDFTERGYVKLMNYHQTKGREADAVIHVFRDDDFFGHEIEPFPQNSRLLNVAVSRARERVVIILPRKPAAIVRPLESLRNIDGNVARVK